MPRIAPVALALIMTLWSAADVVAQSILLEKGQHGYMVAGGYTYNARVHGILLSGGLSYHGEIDLSLGFSRVEAGGLAPAATAIGVGARVFALKQTTEMPISLILSASYGHASHSNVLAYGIGISRSFSSAASVQIVPAVGVTHAKSIPEDRRGGTGEQDTTIFSLEVIFGFRDGQRGMIFLNPGVSTDGEYLTLNLVAGVIGWIGR